MSSREETIKHIRQHIPDESTIDADEHARRIAEVVLRARRRTEAQKCQPKDRRDSDPRRRDEVRSDDRPR